MVRYSDGDDDGTNGENDDDSVSAGGGASGIPATGIATNFMAADRYARDDDDTGGDGDGDGDGDDGMTPLVCIIPVA